MEIMMSSIFDCRGGATNEKRLARFSLGGALKSSLLFLLAALALLTGCGGGSSSTSTQSQSGATLVGNWQFTLSPPPDNSFLGGVQGGFLLQQKNTITGAVTYATFLPAQAGGTPTLCNSGSGPVTGTFDGQNVTLNVVAGAQTFALSGTLSSDGTTMLGTYVSTDGSGCGTAQTGLQWTATLVPTITGAIQGNLHSVLNPLLKNQVFAVTGTLTQGDNIGASNATVTGTLAFQGYPCLTSASVNGQISGSTVILHIIASNGLNVGQIGAPLGFSNPAPVSVLTSTAGSVLEGANGYGISTKSCPGGNIAGDIGDVCLALGSSTSCTQPILLTPATLSFPLQQVGLPPVIQQVGSIPTTQLLTLTNNNLSGVSLTGLSIQFIPQSGAPSVFGLSDFTGLPNFTEQDNCASPAGSTFSLAPQQFCTILISFAPQESCPWLPSTASGGAPPSACPTNLTATLTVNSPASADSNTAFAVPITGVAFSAIEPSTPELDFGAEAVGETSSTQSLSFTNSGANPVQILPALSGPCVNPKVGVFTLPRPLAPGEVAGLQVDQGNITPNGSTINYSCDSDLTSQLPNFQISADGCSGTLLMPQASCKLEIAFAPQPSTPLSPALDYFLELNTLQCTSSITTDCEIDSGRFPVELKANLPSTLRMTPSAGLNFGIQSVGQNSAPLTVTLFNDPKDPNAATVNFTGNLGQGTSFTGTDTCIGSLAPGASCAFTVVFRPNSAGPQTGTITVGYTVGQTQTIYLWGVGQ
jgi:hypothetical protein